MFVLMGLVFAWQRRFIALVADMDGPKAPGHRATSALVLATTTQPHPAASPRQRPSSLFELMALAIPIGSDRSFRHRLLVKSM